MLCFIFQTPSHDEELYIQPYSIMHDAYYFIIYIVVTQPRAKATIYTMVHLFTLKVEFIN